MPFASANEIKLADICKEHGKFHFCPTFVLSNSAFTGTASIRELKLDGAEPIIRRALPPIPAMGIPHSMRWGLLGSTLLDLPNVLVKAI